ncbi:MFS transporter [Acinetobacter pollinis]|uniref:MFS transporter n=1 Tax=Acinetobacter pollinis TaxID=2605270 RepID=A0ABU6DTX0_9GAMM|nr:MFS transporter [Acinetobacter pollinis]MEB5477300.1 MFS transporter [Acinetobacter pollinis]
MNTQTQLVIFIIILSMFGLISSDIYIPSLPFIAQTFHISGGEITFSISIYLIALAISQIIYGVIVNSYGYKRILTLGIIIYIIASIGCALSNHIYSFLFFRFFQGIGAASGLVGFFQISSSGLISYWISHCIGQSISILSLSIFTLSTLCIFLFFFNFQYIDILKKIKLLR